MAQKIILTGDRTSGALHLGHYFGSLVNRKKYENEYETFIMAADVQTLTDNFENPEKVSKNVFETIADNLALDLDLDKTTLFIQSQIPQIAELTVFFSNLVTLNKLLRNPTIKTEIAQKKELFGQDGESVNFGFIGYPVSQAADILFLKADVIPVGEDQLPVIEVCRDIVDRFNSIYGPVFPKPKAMLSEAPRIIGLDGKTKMSKSLGNAVFLKDSEEETISKIKSAKTDSGSTIEYNPDARPEISNLVMLYALTNNISTDQAVDDLKGLNYGSFKMKLAESINTHFREFRQRRIEIASNPSQILEILEIGRERVSIRAKKTLEDVRHAMHIDYENQFKI